MSTHQRSTFRLILPSNSSANYFPENTPAQFTTKLPAEMDLAGEWSVALASIVYPQNWHTLTKEATQLRAVWHDTGTIDKVPVEFYREVGGRLVVVPKTLRLSAGHYTSIEALVDELKSTLAQGIDLDQRGFRIVYDQRTRKLTVGVKKGAELEFSASLSELLGFSRPAYFNYIPLTGSDDEKKHRYETLFQDHTSDRAIDLENGFYNIYVYLDLLEAQAVGDVMVPLLKVVPLVFRDKDLVYHEFEHLSYVPISKNNFDQIGVQLSRDDGELVAFERGNVVLTLAFKKNGESIFL